MSRKTKWTQELEDQLCAGLSGGLTIESACDAVGITGRTFHDWVAKGAKGRRPFAQFSHNVKQATAQLKLTLLSDITKSTDWRAKAWILERRFPEEYGRFVRMEASGPNGGPIKTEGAPPMVVVCLAGDGEDDPYTPPPPATANAG